jgi:hypothetical protein
MLAGRRWAATRKGPVQQLDISYGIHFDPSPVGKRAAAGASYLIPKKLDSALVNPIIVRLDNPRLTSINEPNKALLLDR